MEDKIYSRDVAEIIMVTFMDGVTGYIMEPNPQTGKYERKKKSIISQFLNVNNERTRMTVKIADALINILNAKIEEDNFDDDIMRKLYILIYSISNVDLTYFDLLYQNRENIKKEEIRKIYTAIFNAFVKKESLEMNEIENAVYTTVFGKDWKFLYDDPHAREDTYRNFITNYGKNVVAFKDDRDDYIQNTVKSIVSTIDSYVEKIDYIEALLSTDNQEQFTQKYGKVIHPATEKEIKGKGWKKSYFFHKYPFETFNHTDLDGVIIPGICLYYNYFLCLTSNRINKTLEKLNSYQEEYNTYCQKIKKGDNPDEYKEKLRILSENIELLSSNSVTNLQTEITELKNILQLNYMTNKQSSTFSAFKYKSQCKISSCHSMNDFIRLMVEMLFIGKTNTADKDKRSLQPLYKFIKEAEPQHKFTKKIKNLILERFKKQLKEHVNFPVLLWQFFNYILDIDFYMLKGKHDWYYFLEELLDTICQGITVRQLKYYVIYKYHDLQKENRELPFCHFDEKEIMEFRNRESAAYQFSVKGNLKYYFKDILPSLFQAPDIDTFYRDTEINYWTIRKDSTLKILKEIKDYLPTIKNNLMSNTNEKVSFRNLNIHKILYNCDYLADGLCMVYSINYLNYYNFDFTEIKQELKYIYLQLNEFAKIKYEYFNPNYYEDLIEDRIKKKKFDMANARLLLSKEFQRLYLAVRESVKCISFFDYLKENLNITGLE